MMLNLLLIFIFFYFLMLAASPSLHSMPVSQGRCTRPWPYSVGRLVPTERRLARSVVSEILDFIGI